jgi:signal transduction histidine kinase
MATQFFSRKRFTDWLALAAFIVLYVVVDWLSYMQPMFELNITPWSPEPAIGLVMWLRFGRRTALPWYLALLLSELWVRGTPAGLGPTVLLSAQLVLGYGAIGEVLRHFLIDVESVNDRKRLYSWLCVIAVGLMINGVLYIGLLSLAGLLPAAAIPTAAARFVIADIGGVVVSMPLIWMVASSQGRDALRIALRNWETAAYMLMAVLLVWGVFRGVFGSKEFKHFYFLFLPMIWAATRHGLTGTGLVAFALQASLIGIARTLNPNMIPFSEFQLLGGALTLVGFFIGVMVDEQRRAAEGLKQSLRLAAAGEMAAALAHELNQPMTALSAYGKACEHMLARGDSGPLLVDTIGKMVREAGRASQVVSRLREFFRTGAMHMELARVADIFAALSEQFARQCAAQDTQLTLLADPRLVVRADRLQIELVLRNLIANALDAVHAQTERRIIVTAASLAGRRLQVTVEDTGSGVSHAVAARLFSPFVSGKSSGLGLGLVLSQSIVEAHGGRLWAEVGDKGLFNFILPLGRPGDKLE